MWPTGSMEAKVARLDDALASVAAAIREARANNELHLVVTLEDRCAELLDARNTLAPPQRVSLD